MYSLILIVSNLFLSSIFSAHGNYDQMSASELVRRAEMHIRGQSFEGELTMKVIRGGSKRTLKFKNWSKGKDRSLVKITSPIKDKGTATLRVEKEMWQYLPKIDRKVKIPQSLMMQSWMGSDFSNDDLMKSSSLHRDYNHKRLNSGVELEQDVYKVECMPKSRSQILWGKVVYSMRKKDLSPVKIEYYTEKGKLIKTFMGRKHKKFGKRVIPSEVSMVPYKKSATNRTVLIYSKARFDHNIPESRFTHSFMKRK